MIFRRRKSHFNVNREMLTRHAVQQLWSLSPFIDLYPNDSFVKLIKKNEGHSYFVKVHENFAANKNSRTNFVCFKSSNSNSFFKNFNSKSKFLSSATLSAATCN